MTNVLRKSVRSNVRSTVQQTEKYIARSPFSWRLHGSPALSRFIHRITLPNVLLGYFSGHELITVINLFPAVDSLVQSRSHPDWLGCLSLQIGHK
jgi:hypothetical protein